MCNLYSLSKALDPRTRPNLTDRTGNLAPQPAPSPDQSAPVGRQGDDGRELAMLRPMDEAFRAMAAHPTSARLRSLRAPYSMTAMQAPDEWLFNELVEHTGDSRAPASAQGASLNSSSSWKRLIVQRRMLRRQRIVLTLATSRLNG